MPYLCSCYDRIVKAVLLENADFSKLSARRQLFTMNFAVLEGNKFVCIRD